MFYSRYLLLLSCLYCISCANIKGITGGPEDKTPPALVESRSSPNFQTNFKEREIVFSFNEWIRMDNPSINISISPSTEFTPEYRLKGKRLIIRFDKREVLKDNTTYTIQFGECIKDITAGNIQRSLRYVFSTGNYLDSLSIRAKVIDAFTKKPKEKILVSLYKLLDDTAFQKTKPFYFGWTDTAGLISLNNLSPGFYRLFALEDKNQNYYYDQVNEGFAFFPSTIEIKDTTIKAYLLNLSVKSNPIVIREKQIFPGGAKIYFNDKPSILKLNCESADSIKYVNLKDSILIWYSGNQETSCILQYESKQDTFKIKHLIPPLKDSATFLKMDPTVLKPEQLPGFILNYPVIHVYKDSLQSLDSLSVINNIKYDSLDPRKFYLEGKFSPNKSNRLVIQKNAVQGLLGTYNQRDTFAFRYLEKIALSRLKVILDSLQIGFPYIFQLVNGEVVSEELNFTATESSKNLLFKNLFPGKYRVRLIYDNNKNGQWDPGDYANKIQAENIWYFDLPDLRADWDVDVNIKLLK